MPAETEKTPSSIDDYVDLFGALAGLGIEFVVIGGCAVGAYARLLGEQVLSGDIDLLVTWRSLETVVADAATIGAHVQNLPQPRNVPVALLEWRGREVNLLTGDLLRNKLSVNRPKDQPHIAILRRFLDEEAVSGLAQEQEPGSAPPNAFWRCSARRRSKTNLRIDSYRWLRRLPTSDFSLIVLR